MRARRIRSIAHSRPAVWAAITQFVRRLELEEAPRMLVGFCTRSPPASGLLNIAAES